MSYDNQQAKYNLSEIPLNEIIQDLRVQEFIHKKAREIAKVNIKARENYVNQLESCHSWLLCLHMKVLHKINERDKISSSEFIVLLGCYRLQSDYFHLKTLYSILLSWPYTSVHRCLKKLKEKGYINISVNPYNRKLYLIHFTGEGMRLVRAFSQHFWKVYFEVREELGELPDSLKPDRMI